MRRAHRRDGARLALPRSAHPAALVSWVGLVGRVGLTALASLAGWGGLALGAATIAQSAEAATTAGPGPEAGVGVAAPWPAGAASAAIQVHEPREQREVEDLRRQDLAALLAYWGVPVDWREHSAEELVDWRDRITAAAALRNGFAVSFDWQTMSLAELTDLRLRAAKSAEIAAGYGIQIDWLRYSWAELEDFRGHVVHAIAARAGTEPAVGTAKVTAATATAAADKLAIPASLRRTEAPASSGPAGQVRAASMTGPVGHDPDEIMAPTFGPKSAASPVAKSTGAPHPQDPDAILPPTFRPPAAGAPHPSRIGGGIGNGSGNERRAAGTNSGPAAVVAPGSAPTPAATTPSSTKK